MTGGEVVDGVVGTVLPFGAFVEIGRVTGLPPKSAWSQRPEAGSRILVRVTTIDVTRRRFAAGAA